MGWFPTGDRTFGRVGCLSYPMTPNYFRIAQDLSHAPKTSGANRHVLWALAYGPGAGARRKGKQGSADPLPGAREDLDRSATARLRETPAAARWA